MAAAQNTLTSVFQHRCRTNRDIVALHYRSGSEWIPVTWAQYGHDVERLSQALFHVGLRFGNRVALIGRNTLDWFVVDMAAMTSGLVSVPVYITSSLQQIIRQLHHSEARVIVTERLELLGGLENHRDAVPALEYIIVLDGSIPSGLPGITSMEAFLAANAGLQDGELEQSRARVAPETLATLIYTSGTTGDPKGVMLTHQNSVTTGLNVAEALVPDWGPGIKRSCCYLPLSHVGERVVSILSPLFEQREVFICAELERVMDDVKTIRPTIWLGVPRVWEKIFDGFQARHRSLSPFARRLITWSIQVALDNQRRLQQGAPPLRGVPALKHRIAHRLVIRKILESLGLDRVRISITGGAPGNPEVADFFSALGLWMQEVYGQTEGYGTTSLSLRTDYRARSCGRPFPRTEVRIAADGEILLRGGSVSPGYFKDTEATAETFVDGWLHSGDLGHFDEDGYLWVTGRKKDIIITSGGKNISPHAIETAFSGLPGINGAVVAGEGRNYLVVVVDVDTTAMRDALPPEGDLEEHVKAVVVEHLDAINARFSRAEQVKKCLLVFDRFTQEQGLVTPTMKVRRAAVLNRFATEISAMYEKNGDVFTT